MQYPIKDPEVLMLATIAGTLEGDYVREGQDDPWAGSPFWADMMNANTQGTSHEA